ncbi:MAG TPA: RNA methyltransferase [Candidatus Acidoferrales bacterium]|nr:RNA methyltransferase [Candidatus Acidoferrales bacterium]
MRVTKIDFLDLPELEPYRTMRRTLEHRAIGIFVAEGEKVVCRLIESDLELVSILLTQEWLDQYRDILSSRLAEEGVFVAEKVQLEQIVGYGLHQGIMAIGRVPRSLNIFEFLEKCPKPRLFVAVDGIANSENMGVIVRNCAAFGVQALVVGETSCDPYLRRSVRNSMGTIFNLPIVNVDRLSETMKKLSEGVRSEHEKSSIRIIAADPKHDSSEISGVDLTEDICLVFGSEGEGISGEVLENCSVRMKIPMHHDVDSINVGSSVGVILYEAVRQRGKPKPRI